MMKNNSNGAFFSEFLLLLEFIQFLLVIFRPLINMDLINDFIRILKVIRWREPTLKFVATDHYAQSLADLKYTECLKNIENFLKWVQVSTLLSLFKPFILKRESVIQKLVLSRINDDIKYATEVIRIYNQQYGKCDFYARCVVVFIKR